MKLSTRSMLIGISMLIMSATASAQAARGLLGAPVLTPPTSENQQWEIRADDQRLATSFERWARLAGINIKWDAPKHVLVSATTVYSGSLENAIFEALASPGIFYSEDRLEACFYPNTPALVRITRFGDQKRECPFKE